VDRDSSDILNPSLGELIDKDSFTEVCLSYYQLFDLPMRVFDVNGDLVAETARSFPICGTFGKFEDGKKLCLATRTKVKNALPKESSLLSIDCVTGLRYTAAPIAFQGSVIGKVVFGPYRPAEDDKRPAVDKHPNLDLGLVTRQLESMRRTSVTVVRKIAHSLLSVVDAILFSAHKTLLTGQMHLASQNESFRALAEKNRELEAMNERMKEFERIKSSFLSTVSHELRTPLTSIIGYSDMLSEGIAGELLGEQKQFIDTIKNKGEELLQLISSILDFSQIDTGHLNLRKQETSPIEVIESAVQASEEKAARRGIRLSTRLNKELQPVSMDPEKIHTALAHLIDNAVKFSAPDGVVRVSAEMVEALGSDTGEDDGLGFVLLAAPEQLEISVQDFGEGIEKSQQEAIFSPFTQLDDSSTREHGGAGLGLAVVKQFVEAHGGTVTVSSNPGEGSRFTVRLPVIREE
jgi:two-component system sensor histidine kinase BarA